MLLPFDSTPSIPAICHPGGIPGPLTFLITDQLIGVGVCGNSASGNCACASIRVATLGLDDDTGTGLTVFTISSAIALMLALASSATIITNCFICLVIFFVIA